MKYIVIELQTNDVGEVATIVTAYDTYLAAQNKYHLILAAAAVSNVAKHGACIITNEGVEQEYRIYTHLAEEE